jgi:guanidinopropionase
MNDRPSTPDYLVADPIATGPRFGGIMTFFHLPLARDATGLDIAVCGVPFDGGITNRAGARSGPRAVREMSWSHIRPYHPVDDTPVFEGIEAADIGDVMLIPTERDASLDMITAFFADIAAKGALPLAVGGDHLVSLPILRALAADRPVGMIHFDAHTDTYDSIVPGRTEFKYDNGTVFRRAVEEGLLAPERVVQIGIRGPRFTPDDLGFSLNSGMRVITMDEFDEIGPQGAIAEARRVVGDGPTYLSFDIDALDAVFCPGTGSPEIGGYTSRQAQVMLRGLTGLNLIGADLVEVAPPLDTGGQTARVAAHLLFDLMYLLRDAALRRDS